MSIERFPGDEEETPGERMHEDFFTAALSLTSLQLLNIGFKNVRTRGSHRA